MNRPSPAPSIVAAAGPIRAALRAALLAGIALGIAAEARPQEAQLVNDIIPYPSDTRTLDNGLTVIVLRMPSDGLVAYWSIVRTGSRDEYEPGRSGFAHFFEHMMFRGTERYPPELYQRVMTAIGADANAYTSDDHTAYHVTVAAEDLERIVEVESDRFQNLAYSATAFQTEAGAVYGEYRKSRTDPFFVLHEATMAAAFHRHTYGHTTMGYEQDIAAMPTLFDYSRQFFARYYRPENTVLLVVGDVETEAVMRLIERHYGGWRRGYAAPAIPDEPEQTAERRVDVAYDGQSLPLLWIGYKIPRFDPADRQRVAADLLAELAFGETSEAYRRLVLDEQVVEFLDAGADPSRDPRLLDVSARIKDPAKVDYVQGIIDATVARYRDAPPDQQRLADLKRRLKYAFLMGLQTPDAVAGRLAEHVAITGGLDGVRALYAAYAAVEPADVQRAAELYFDAERRTVGVLRSRQ